MAPYWILAAGAAGIGLSSCVQVPAAPWPAATAALLALLWLGLWRRSQGALPLAGALALAGFLWAHQWLQPPQRPDDITRQLSASPIAIEGIVRQVEYPWNGGVRLDVEVLRVGSGAAASGLIRLTVHEGDPIAVPGDRVAWHGRLRRPQLLGTPGEFDYPRYLAARGIYVTSSVGQSSDLAVMAAGPRSGRPFWERCRAAIARRIAASLPPERAGLVQAITIGSGSGISPQQRKVLGDGGLAHLFSISGLHFGLLAVMLYGIALQLYRRSERLLLAAPPRRVLPVALLLPLAGYLFLSGCGAPTRRAFIMTAAGALLFSTSRRTPPLALLASAACVMLALSPLSLFEPSFQLSFAGVLGLVVWLPRWQRHLDGRSAWQRGIGLMFLTTLAASLATAPFALWHFHQIAPAGLLTNLAAIPLVGWGAVPAGLLGTVLLPLAPRAADLCFALSGELSALAMRITEWTLNLPGLGATRLFVTCREWLGILLLLVAVMLPAGRRRAIAVIAAAGLVLMLLPASTGARLEVTALSVGQGDATVLTFDGRHYLVDGGSQAGAAFDLGERLLAPALGRLGIRRLAGVVLTHDHPDHSSGLPYVIENIAVDGFWSALPPDRLDQRLAAALARRRTPVHTLPRGWNDLPGRNGQMLKIFVPDQTAPDLNDRSLVVHATDRDAGVLLTGDLAGAGYDDLCLAGLPAPVTLLKLPHHGSRGSRPESFLDRLQPDLAFVSAGLDNAYRLPHPASVEACRVRGVPLYRTDRQGTLTFRSRGNRWQVQCFKGVEH